MSIIRANTRLLHWRREAVLAVIVLVAGAGAPRAACDCATSTGAPWCSASSVTYTNHRGTTQTINFGSQGGSATYTCGQYANGDVWVLGRGTPKAVVVMDTTPSWDGKTNGWMANPGFDENHIESRGKWAQYDGPPVSLPHTFSTEAGPVSFLKGTGKPLTDSSSDWPCKTGDHKSCVKFISVTTFVNEIPDTDGDGSTADEFRPAYAGAGSEKPGPFKIDGGFDTRANGLPSLSRSSIDQSAVWTLQKVADRFRYVEPHHMTSNGWILMGADNTSPKVDNCVGCGSSAYGLTRANTYSAGILRLFLDDFDWSSDPVSRQALIGIVQMGIDMYSAYKVGRRWNAADDGRQNWGGGVQGAKLPFLFSAYMLADAGMKAVVQGGNFFEDDEVYYGEGGVPFYGVTGDAGICPSACAINCAIPSHDRDTSCCDPQPKSYMSMSSNQMPYQRLVVKLLGVEDIWNHDAYLDYAYSWMEGGRAPGHTKYRWSNTSHWCRNTRDNNGYWNRFGDEMWSAYKNLGAQVGGQQASPPAGEGLLAAPLQIIP